MNQNPEQRARDAIDRQLINSGWIIQNKNSINLDAGPGVAVREWLKSSKSLRGSLQGLGELPTAGLRDCQIDAITRLEQSFRDNRPRALVQMATGSGKTFTAITFVYRFLKYTNARRILFLVDTQNLGEQAER